MTAGAAFVARGTVYHARLMEDLIEKSIKKRGFGVVEVLSNCHVQYGRRNKMGNPVHMMEWFKEHAVTVEKAQDMKPAALKDKFTIGVLADVEKPVYTEEYRKIQEKAKP